MPPASIADVLLRRSWLALLLLPNVTTLALANAWEADWRLLALASVWVVALLYALLPRRVFLVLTYPVVVAGAIVVGADQVRSASALELLAVAYTFKPAEVADALRPYFAAIALVAIAAFALLVVLWRRDVRAAGKPRLRLALGLAGIVSLLAVPQAVWLNTWPVSLLYAAAQSQSLDVGIQLSQVSNARVSPRDRRRSWHGARRPEAAGAETYVLVIGETVRADRVKGCGGRPEITPPPRDALLFCDVLAGGAGSHTAVPLLISRELPGRRERMSSDATFQKAFEEAGYETFWLSVQQRSIAWPDAGNQSFIERAGLDRELLLPPLDGALARSSQRKMIVLHPYNAHEPYTERYAAATAPLRVDAKLASSVRAERLKAYDNAVDESMRFLAAVVDRLRAQSAPAFLIYTSDHGENLEDDARRLVYHALKFPTAWDTRVPMVVWANDSWRRQHAAQWDMLAHNQRSALMHMDIVPTLLGAAQVAYEDPRTLPVDLTARIAPQRERFVEGRGGARIGIDTLYSEAGAPAMPAASD